MGPYRIHLDPVPDDEDLWLRLDQALEMSLRDPEMAYWSAFDVWIDALPKKVRNGDRLEYRGGNAEVAAAAQAMLETVAPPVDERSMRRIGAAFRRRP